MTRTIQQAAEFCAREFLGAVKVSGDWFMLVGESWTDGRKPCPHPEPSWPFFGALWEECERRGWAVEAYCHRERGGAIVEGAYAVTGPGLDESSHHRVGGDPREALVRAVEQWLDAREGD